MNTTLQPRLERPEIFMLGEHRNNARFQRSDMSSECVFCRIVARRMNVPYGPAIRHGNHSLNSTFAIYRYGSLWNTFHANRSM